MNKDEQAQLCMLLAKLRYDLMEDYLKTNFQNETLNDLIEAINKIMGFSFIDGSVKNENKNSK